MEQTPDELAEEIYRLRRRGSEYEFIAAIRKLQGRAEATDQLWEEALRENVRVCPECGREFLPGREDQIYFPRRCATRVAKRASRRRQSSTQSSGCRPTA